MLSNLDILKLVPIPVADGTLYLYPEYVVISAIKELEQSDIITP